MIENLKHKILIPMFNGLLALAALFGVVCTSFLLAMKALPMAQSWFFTKIPPMIRYEFSFTAFVSLVAVLSALTAILALGGCCYFAKRIYKRTVRMILEKQ